MMLNLRTLVVLLLVSFLFLIPPQTAEAAQADVSCGSFGDVYFKATYFGDADGSGGYVAFIVDYPIGASQAGVTVNVDLDSGISCAPPITLAASGGKLLGSCGITGLPPGNYTAWARSPGTNPPECGPLSFTIVNLVATPGLPDDYPIPTSEKLAVNIYRSALGIAVIIAIFRLFASAYMYITSSNDPYRLEDAKETFISTIYGLLFIVLAGIIIKIIAGDLLDLVNVQLVSP